MEQLYVVKVRKSGRWQSTFWTRGGNPVSKRIAEDAAAAASKQFPAAEFSVREVKPKKVRSK